MLNVLNEPKSLSAKEIRQAWSALPESTQKHSSTQALWEWLKAYQSEDTVRSCYEWRSEVRELSYEVSRQVGQGIHIGTIHSAKGLEFDTVMVLAGKEGSKGKKNEELRLRYVAMTRAEKNLILMQDDSDYPWFSFLPIDSESLDREVCEESALKDIYTFGMQDVVLGFMGRQAKPTSTRLIDVGSPLALGDKGIILHDSKRVGKLSSKMRKHLEDLSKQGWQVSDIKVHAVVRRHQKDEARPEACKQGAWDVIIPEMTLQRNTYG